MTKLGRPSIWQQHREEWVRLFEDEGLSRGQIARRFGTSVQSVTRQLSEAGVDLTVARVGDGPRPRTPEEQAIINAKVSEARKGKGTGPRVEREDRTCENPGCGKSFQYIPGRSGERFCSRTCRNEFRAGENRMGAEENYALDPRRCPCGDAIPFEYRHTRLYCSPEHRSKYQAKRAKDPTRQKTFNCLNCGKEVTRYKGYGNGHNKYCSNSCANKHTKTRKFYAVEDFDIVFESSWETLFWGLCMFRKVPIERFDRANAVEWKPGQWYAPDFWLPTLNVAVEIKGNEDPDDSARWTVFREANPGLTDRRLAVIGKDELQSLLHANDFEARLYGIAHQCYV